MKVLVTDGHLKAALSAARSLGRNGTEVHVTQNKPGTTASSLSKYVRANHLLPPYEQGDAFGRRFLELLRREHFDYVLPVSDEGVRRLAANRCAVACQTRIDLPPMEALELVWSKTGL